MSDIKITVCDKEGCKKRRTKRYKVFSHCESDPSGNGSNTWYRVFDLCPEHQREYDRAMNGGNLKDAGKVLRQLRINFDMR